MIYASKPRSYRDLPVRLAEFGTVYRYEQSGELTGMLRVRGFTQDDSHLFVTPDQLGDEFKAVVDLMLFTLKRLGLEKRKVPIGCVGSVFNAGKLLTKPMIELINQTAPKAYLQEPLMPPSHAGALMAMKNGEKLKI